MSTFVSFGYIFEGTDVYISFPIRLRYDGFNSYSKGDFRSVLVSSTGESNYLVNGH